MVGGTIPHIAKLDSIRSDFSITSPNCSTPEKRVLYNLVHASESTEEARREIALWFGDNFNTN